MPIVTRALGCTAAAPAAATPAPTSTARGTRRQDTSGRQDQGGQRERHGVGEDAAVVRELDPRPVDRRRERGGHPARAHGRVDREPARAPDRRGQDGEGERQPHADQDEREGVDGHDDVAGQLGHDGREQVEAGRVEQGAAAR